MRSSGIQLRIGDFLFSIQKRWKLIVALTLVGLMFGLLLSGVTYVQSGLQSFEVSGAFVISTVTNETYLGGYPNPSYNDFMMPPDMVDAVNYIVQSDHVLNEVINRQNLLGMSAALLRRNLTLTQYNATQIVEMQVNWYNAEEGVGIWNAIIEVTNEFLPQTLQVGTVMVINEPEAVMVGAGGSGGKLWVALTVLGFLSGLGFAVMELLMHPTLTNVKDVETVFGMETLGIIPRDNYYFRKKTSFLVNDVDSSEVVQNFSAAAYIIRSRLGTKEKHHCFYVTSATAQEGKSTVAANLAIQLSDMEHKTLLVDLDMRNPRLGSMFLENVDYNRSFNALYSGEATVDDVVTTLTGYLDIMPSLIGNNMISIDSTIVELFDQLKDQYEYIVIDAPPVGEVSGTLSLNQVSDTALFVVGYDMATIPEIQNSLDKLDKTGVRVLGCIVNAAQTSKSKGIGKDEKKARKIAPMKTAQDSFARNAEEEGADSAALVTEGSDGGSKKKKKSGKRRLLKRKTAPAGETVPEERTGPIPVRNAFEDIVEAPAAENRINDQQVMAELLKIGISGDFGADAEEDGVPAQEETPATAEDAPQKTDAEPSAPEPAPPAETEEKAAARVETQSAPAPQIVIQEEAAPAEETAIPTEETTVPPAAETSEAAVSAPMTANAEFAGKTRRKARAILPLFILFAIPFTAAGIAVLTAVSLALACASTVGLALSVNGFLTAFETYSVLADRLAAAGLSLIVLVVGLSLLWLFIKMLLHVIPGFVRGVIAFGRKRCFKEVKA